MSVNLSIHSNIRDYELNIEESPDFIDELASHSQAYFVVDENVWNIYAKSLLRNLPSKQIVILPISEDHKVLNTVLGLYEQLVKHPAKRNLTLISFGGGILQDITGFTASTLYRGINWILIPTTLLAQSDSCIGSKTSLNYRGYKNLIGTFYPPSKIYIFIPFLKTQKETDYYSGIGEVIKLHLMGGEKYFRTLAKYKQAVFARDANTLLQVIRSSLDIKLSYMAGDEFDTGRRNFLNYGHDFGHALESTSNYAIPHGQAVIFGMLAANIIAKNRGLLNQNLANEIANELLIPGLKVPPTLNSIQPKVIVEAMKKDKKRTGDLLALIMMQNKFEFLRVNDLTPNEVTSALSECRFLLKL